MSCVVGLTLGRLPERVCVRRAETAYEMAHARGAMTVTPRLPAIGPQA